MLAEPPPHHRPRQGATEAAGAPKARIALSDGAQPLRRHPALPQRDLTPISAAHEAARAEDF